jgi:hypothetical protein
MRIVKIIPAKLDGKAGYLFDGGSRAALGLLGQRKSTNAESDKMSNGCHDALSC